MIDPDIVKELKLLRKLAAKPQAIRRHKRNDNNYSEGFAAGFRDAIREVFHLIEDEMGGR